MTTKLEKSVELAKNASFNLRVISAEAAVARLRKDDMSGGDLAAGGLKAPEQANPVIPGGIGSKKPKHHDAVAKVVDYQGIPVHVDRPRGHVQTGTDDAGATWKRYYHVDYGFVPNTQGGDQEGVDVFLGLDPEAKDAHWILQKKSDGTFDEYKVMLGFPDADMAKGMYLAHVPKRFFGSMSSTSVGMMKALLGLHPAETMKALKSFVVDGELELTKKIEHKDDGWHVYSEDGSKHLGGPYDTKAAAVDRLAQVEGHAEKRVALVERDVRLVKAEPAAGELRYSLGIVLEPETVDAQKDIYSADEVRKAAWDYMVNFRNVGLMHKGLVNHRVRLVESYIAPIDMNVGGSVIKAGTWLMGLHVNDDALWEQVKSGGLTGLSIGGFASKSPV